MGATQINATNVAWVDATTMTCDFDLTGAPVGDYDVYAWSATAYCPQPGILVGGFEVIPCETTFVAIDPDSGTIDTVATSTIELAACEDGASLGATLISANPDIVGTNATWIDATHFSIDFDLTGAALGMYDLQVYNGCGGDGDYVVDGYEVKVATQIPPVDDTPIGEGNDPPVPPSNPTFNIATDIACRDNDGGFYISWDKAGDYTGGYVDRYSADGNTVLMDAQCNPAGSDYIYYDYERVGLAAGSVGTSHGWACVADPVVHFGNDETNTNGANDSYGFWYGNPYWWTVDAAAPVSGNVYSYANFNYYGSHYLTNWEHYYNGSWNNASCNYGLYTIGSDFDGRENLTVFLPVWRTDLTRMGMGQTNSDF